MRAHVLVLPQQGHHLLAVYSYYGDGRGARPRPNGASWEDFCETEVRRAQRGDYSGCTAFICLPGDGLAVAPDEQVLEQILNDIRRYSWGAESFLVTPKRQPGGSQLAENLASLERFLKLALRRRVQGLLQVDSSLEIYQADGPEPPICATLWKAVNRQRRHTLVSGPDLSWRCLLPEESLALRQLEGQRRVLGALEQPWKQEGGSNLLVVVNRAASDDQVQTITRACAHFPERRKAVVALGTNASSSLNEYCRSHELGEAVYLQGILELWYFLLALNHRGEVFQGAAEPRLVEAVEIEAHPRFSRGRDRSGLPGLLLTNSFDPMEPGHCHAASADAGTLLDLAPLAMPYQVERMLNPERLGEILGQERPPRIWVHSGHGEARKGLQTQPLGQFVASEAWVGCLRAKDVPLDLVLLLTCDSAEIARRFAQAGVPFSIGFEGEIPTSAPGRLAEEVLKAVFSQGLTAVAALDGFYRGVDRLKGSGPLAPKAYYTAWS